MGIRDCNVEILFTRLLVYSYQAIDYLFFIIIYFLLEVAIEHRRSSKWILEPDNSIYI